MRTSNHLRTNRSPTSFDTVRYGELAAAIALLGFLFTLPEYVTSLPASPYTPWSIEALVIATLLAASSTSRFPRAARTIGVVVCMGYLFYAWYDALVYTATYRNGIVYEDVQFVTNALYLVPELATPDLMGPALLGGAAAIGMGAMIPYLVRSMQAGGTTPSGWVLLFSLHLIAWPVVLWHAPAQEWGTEHRTYREVREDYHLRTLTAKIHANIDASLALRQFITTLDEEPLDSTYYDYADLDLSDAQPPLYWFLIESYGMVMTRHPELREPFAHLVQQLERDLAADGWHVATATGPAPIQGGRSFLAHATLLSGMHINRQLLNSRLQRYRDYPFLVRTLQDQGYTTIGLQPPNRARPGLPLSDPYQFDTTLFFDDLGYEAPHYGWGKIPDQYSLYYTHENALPHNTPYFLFFAMADSHALWRHGKSPFVEDWRAFNQAPDTTDQAARAWMLQQSRTDQNDLLPRDVQQSIIFNQPPQMRYLRTVAHNFRLIRHYLAHDAPDDALVWILGDHQPPVFELEDAEVPIHVLTRDPERLEPFLAEGFERGLRPHPETQATWPLEGLYSLTMRALAQYNGYPPEAVPLRPHGVSYRMMDP